MSDPLVNVERLLAEKNADSLLALAEAAELRGDSKTAKNLMDAAESAYAFAAGLGEES